MQWEVSSNDCGKLYYGQSMLGYMDLCVNCNNGSLTKYIEMPEQSCVHYDELMK